MNKNPGPGRYESDKGLARMSIKNKKNKSASAIMTKSNRINFISKNKAGVGDYEILQKKTGGISMPKAERFAKPNKNPGPGDYHFQSTISNFTFYKKK